MSNDKKFTRRELIENMKTIAAGGALAGTVPWISLLSENVPASVAPSDKVNVGFIGTGSRGKALIRYANNVPAINIAATCDNYEPNFKRGLEIAKGSPKGYKDYKKLLKDKSIDCVIIATPLHLHAQMVLDAFAAGKHVFCEKTLTKTIEEAKQVSSAQKETGLILQTGHQRIFDIRYLKAFEDMKAGKLGKITQIRAYWHRNGDWRRHVPKPSLERKINWRMYREYSLGLMTELASHHLQVANWFLGATPEKVMGSGSINYWKDGREVYDNVNVVYRYPGGIHVIYDSLISNKHYGCELQMMGDKGLYELELGKFYSENPPAPAGILRLINDIEHSIFDPVPIAGASWVPETASKYKGEYIVDMHRSRIPNNTLLSLEAFAETVKKGKPVPGMLEHGIDAAVAVILGDKAMVDNEIVNFQKELA
ncbi:Gfo/Idh/MocA family protein [Sedimentisphaera salicampi]|uniref:Inositol 2-dehydrogenase n=1 Tax=Sedimentisphaera salicampi TaxID=1941349 RepID=A0A1W6LJB7_9BACT|nr:Gfo/Idh/MocA family oxidoreductase [Sedimentisphaera salicampi]ARN55877.1 Inositol 2-dehydrogenase [Sedimentisphaera salicampi]OXU16068.1 Inositol 2-dehydrogenase [Sedimentisphaera salicampi]